MKKHQNPDNHALGSSKLVRFRLWVNRVRFGGSVDDLERRDGSMLICAQVGGIDQSHGVQIIPPADRRLLIALNSDQKLGHRADEGVGKPTGFPHRFCKCGIAP